LAGFLVVLRVAKNGYKIKVTYANDSQLFRSVLLSAETELLVKGRTRDAFTDIHVTMDGKNGRLFPEQAEIHLRRSPHTAKIIKIGTNRFYDILETKMNKK
jgi:NAD kinase